MLWPRGAQNLPERVQEAALLNRLPRHRTDFLELPAVLGGEGWTAEPGWSSADAGREALKRC